MQKLSHSYSTLFIDIGGVLLTNGWDRESRDEAIKIFHLDKEETDARHALAFDMYEQGKVSLDVYLDLLVFYKPRTFSKEDFKTFMFSQSKPFPEMLELIKSFKNRFQLKVVAVSNEGRELMLHRIHAFKLKDVIDFFVCSGFVRLRKPDPAIFHMAIDLAQTDPRHGIYIDDRLMLVEVAETFGLKGIHHTNCESTKQLLSHLLS